MVGSRSSHQREVATLERKQNVGNIFKRSKPKLKESKLYRRIARVNSLGRKGKDRLGVLLQDVAAFSFASRKPKRRKHGGAVAKKWR